MQLLRDPLIHFAVAGALLFAGYQWVTRGEREVVGVEAVRISAGDVRWVKDAWAKLWLREPDPAELRGLLTELVEEELLAREATEMGLDEGDTIVRRRLAQKLKFLVEDTSHLVDPSEDELRRFYTQNAKSFEQAPRASFTQVFFNSSTRANAESDAKATLADLQMTKTAIDLGSMGDRLLISGDFEAATEESISGALGPDFARAVFALEPGQWSGPIKSGYGAHLVFVSEIVTAKHRGFDEARADILQEYRRQMRQQANRDYITRLREKYGVVLDEDVQALISQPPANVVAQ